MEPKKELKLHWFVWNEDLKEVNTISIKAVHKESEEEIKTQDFKLNEVGTPITDIYDTGLIPIKNSSLETIKQRPFKQAKIPITLSKEGVWEFIVFVDNEEYSIFEVFIPKTPNEVEYLEK